MAFTPLLKPLNLNGTTFYAFASAAKDLSKCLANSQKEFVFSHFVCLNIPDFINVSNYNHGNTANKNSSSNIPDVINKNYFQFNGIYDSSEIDAIDSTNPTTAVKTSSKKLADQLQAYVFNFEEKLLNDSTDNTDRSVAERVFWHWLRHTCAINWHFDEDKIAPDLRYQQSARFVEGPNQQIPTYEYENVVKYIGNIDITNNVDIANEAYTEIYIHIPSEAGETPTVLFEQCFDGNFSEGGNYEITNGQDYILGQTGPDTSIPLDTRAIYDTNGRTFPHRRYEVANKIVYGNQPSTLPYTNGVSEWKTNGYKTEIDGVCIDFNANSYNDIVSNNIHSIGEFNKLGNSFEFNAILVYYDIVDISSGNRVSNLYGVLFLDDVKSETWDYFQRYPKYKPIAGVQNGNSYGFKLNFRIDIEPNKSGITTLVNEYNTFSMSLFSDAMTKMQECAEMFTRMRGNISNIETRLNDLESLLSSVSNYEELANRVQSLQDSLENANLAFADRSSLLDLIAHTSDNVDSIMSGRANVQVQYNTDVVKKGYGIDIDTHTPNQIKVNSTNYGYSICTPLKYNDSVISKNNKLDMNNPNDLTNTVKTTLKQSTNMLILYTENQASDSINIYINTAFNQWKPGQDFKIVFKDTPLSNLNNNSIKVTTNDTTIIINASDYINDNPIIELVCINPLTKDYIYNIIR